MVITIIGMLAAILLPAVQASRESPRRSQCSNNQKQLSLGLLHHESTHRSFPCWVNQLKTERPYEVPSPDGQPKTFDFIDVSWMVLLLPQLERNDLYRAWQDPAQGRTLIGFIREACCPSDPPASTGSGAAPLGYVVNAGNDFNVQIRDFGICFDRSSMVPTHSRIEVGAAYISAHDGTTTTLLLSENVRISSSRVWALPSPPFCAPPVDGVGFLWAVGITPHSQYKINQDLEGHHPRPSSRHPGGVNATFCDGHQQFLHEEIDYLTYQHLMTPHSMGAGCFLHAQPDHWVCESLQDQFGRGRPPMFEPGPSNPPNLYNSTPDAALRANDG